jgi:nitrogen fixation/metabolism regulation signal transduction histidine kinase
LISDLGSILWPVWGATALGILLVIVAGTMVAAYISRPISQLEEGLLMIINGKTDMRFELEHEELGGLVFRINSLLNALTGVPENEESPANSSLSDT